MRLVLCFFIWGFCCLVHASVNYDFVVAADGTGNFATVQEAINAVPDCRKQRTTIYIKKGIYKEKIVLAESKKNVTLIGESRDSTILTYDDYALKKNIFGEDKGTSGSSSFYVYGDDFRAENITFQNSSGPVGQAVAVLVKADRVSFVNCNFLGFQDTLYAHGSQFMLSRQYYKNCYIEGTVDFIFGWATAWFEGCVIHCKSKSGYVTAASTPQQIKYGFVFRRCRLTAADTSARFYLGRPWRVYSSVTYLECELGKHILPQGWDNWSKPEAEQTVRYAEYKSTGPGANAKKRVAWARALLDDDVKEFSMGAVLGGTDDWNPTSLDIK